MFTCLELLVLQVTEFSECDVIKVGFYLILGVDDVFSFIPRDFNSEIFRLFYSVLQIREE